MTGYEVVCRAIEFERPDRLPLRYGSPEMNDSHSVSWNQTGTGDREMNEALDEWGCLWVRTEMQNMGQVKGHPLSNWERLDSFRWPDPDNPALYDGMERHFAGSDGKYVTTGIFMLLFERMHALHGFANTLADLYLERERIELLADQIVAFDLRIIRNIADRFPGQIHGFSFTDDWGTQEDVFIRPVLWDEFFGPRYKRIFDACHEVGWHVLMHSCGRVNKIIGSLIDIGLDVINLQQPRALGIKEIGEQFQGRVCFESLCDIQHTLPFATREQICAEAHLLLDCWATSKGGFILGDYGDGAAIGVSDETKQVMLKAFLDADRWRER